MPHIIFKPSLLLYFLLPLVGLFVGGLVGAWQFSVLGIALFVNVFLHEFGHWWVASRYGSKYSCITIGATGGSTSYSGTFMSNRQLACVIIAGPMMNILVGIISAFLCGPSGIMTKVSFCLAIFNLLPIANLDGAQLFTIFLGRYFDYPERMMRYISLFTAMGVVAYLFFSLQTLSALVGIYFVGYLFMNNRR
jgi:Zn-dependent protease